MEKEEDQQSLLHGREPSHSIRQHEVILEKRLRKKNRHILSLYLLISCLFILTLWAYTTPHDPSLALYSPANSAIEYENVLFYENPNKASPYFGEPNDTKDSLWTQLYRPPSMLRIDPATARRLPNQTVSAHHSSVPVISLEVRRLQSSSPLRMLREQVRSSTKSTA